MNALEYAKLAVSEIKEIIGNTEEGQLECLVSEILHAKSIYIAGAGRSLLMVRAFAMRLMHIGLNTHVVGDVTTPAIAKDDLLLIASASGETGTLLVIKEKARKIGSKIAVITAHPNSTLARDADLVVMIPGATDKVAGGFQSKQPAGNCFEQSLLVIADGMIMELAERLGLNPSAGFSNHANLE